MNINLNNIQNILKITKIDNKFKLAYDFRRSFMFYSFEEREPQLLGNNHYIFDNATIIGSVIIENNVCILPNAVVRADNDLIRIGEGQIFRMGLFYIQIQVYQCI